MIPVTCETEFEINSSGNMTGHRDQVSRHHYYHSGPALAGAGSNARPRCGPLWQWRYDVIVLSQPCYDLFYEDVLANNNMNIKNSKLLELICMYQQFLFYLLFGGAWAYIMCPQVTSMFMTKHAGVVDITQCIGTTRN